MKLFFQLIVGCLFFQAQAQLDYSINTTFEPIILGEEDCDACGCSNTGGNFGFGDLVEKNSITVRYLHQEYKSKETLFNNSPWSREQFNTLQALALFSVHQKIKVLSILPYHFLNREASTFSNTLQGVGDVSIMGIYELFKTKEEKAIQQQWYAGVGLKLPTGTYDVRFRGNTNPGFQLGTGSLDYLFLTEYQVSYQNFNWSSFLNYIYKTENENDFRFGNQLNFSTTLGYQWQLNNTILIPQLGYAYEHTNENVDFGVVLPNSNSTLHLLKIGMATKWNNFTFGAYYFDALSQNLFNRTVRLQHRLNISLTYKFNFKKRD